MLKMLQRVDAPPRHTLWAEPSLSGVATHQLRKRAPAGCQAEETCSCFSADGVTSTHRHRSGLEAFSEKRFIQDTLHVLVKSEFHIKRFSKYKLNQLKLPEGSCVSYIQDWKFAA